MNLQGLKRKFGILAVGHSANWLMTNAFDYVLYPFVIFHLGLLYGMIVMTILSTLDCLGTLWFYNWSKKDWLGIEMVKAIRDEEKKTPFGRFISWIMSKGDPVALIVLSIQFDPFITTVYLRKGSNSFGSLSKRDWKIFAISIIVANAFWSVLMLLGIETVGGLLKYVLSW